MGSIISLVKDMTIRSKMIISFLVMIAFMVIIGMVGFSSMKVIRSHMQDIFNVRMPGIDFLIEADRDLQQLLVAERSMIFADVGSEEYKAFMGDYEENFQQSAARWAKYKALASTPEEKAILPKFDAARTKWEEISRRVWDARGDGSPEGRKAAIALSQGEASAAFEGMRDYIDQLTEINLGLARAADKAATESFSGAVTTLLMITSLGFLAGLFFAFVSIRSVSKPLSQVIAFAEDLRQGDISVSLPEGKDEIGVMSQALNRVVDELKRKTDIATAISSGDLRQEVNISSEKDAFGKALQNMVWRLNDVVQKLHNAANQVDGGSQQVSESSQTLSQGATEQASSLEEITSSMTEIGAQTRTNAENAGQASNLAHDAKNAAEKGVNRMMEMTRSMSTISESSQEIAKIIKVIDDIAFQTNLLALNAAVESARAGVHGKGFAVVAQEVRTLAARSAKAAQGITELIESAVNNVKEGSEIAENTSAALDEIQGKITKASDLVAEIAAASNEQSKGISQINEGLSQIDSVTQQNAANAEETSASSEELSAQAASLRKALTFFKIKGDSSVGFATPNYDAAPRSAQIGYQGYSKPAPKKKPSPVDAGWGAPGDAPMEVDPGQVIALDDDDFGKY
ncbi:Methyl-accepting chemotaxis sensory transducer [Desulfatibacillum aliphaticivorans]|uniref:Methyl-accepting chemotaxis sensory transducer n=1 Tax=Desulfatibacillum aliphaticivorans TaxID=218208 RepID=B8FDK1_DESAL|nr:methyl-accepting chemotaxis protein [Desulfatibacillum aliphaticivorans]ACL06632.1 Methyl-accepting chemotaxis sensory transducer [Desulfatibacillum aliphaticivorans]